MDENLIIANSKTLRSLNARLRQFRTLGRRFDQDVVKKRMRELSVAAEKPADEVEQSFWEKVYDYEQVLSEMHGRPTRATYTRRSVRNSSVEDFLTKLIRKDATYGWKILEEANRPEASYETVIEDHREKFPSDVVEVALDRLRKARKVN